MATHLLLVAIRTECRNNICRDNIYAVIKKDVPRDVVINNDQEEEDINFDDIKIS
jgi:PTS system fructose-specific IIC component